MKLSALSAFDIDWVVSKQTSQLKKKENRKKNQERFWFQISSHKWSVAGIILFIERDRKYSETVKWENNNQYIIRLTYVHKISFTYLWYLVTANISECGPMPTPWKILDSLPVIPSCLLGQN